MTADAATADSSDLTLNPAARVLWRSTTTVQVELGDRALIVTGLTPAAVRRLTGYRPRPSSTNSPIGLDETGELLAQATARLHASGFLIRSRTGPAVQVPRLAAEVLALQARHGERAEPILHRRRDAAVVVHGTTRVATVLAGLLAAAGIGRVSMAGAGFVRLHQAAPGGVSVGDEGARFSAAANAALARAAPDCDTRTLPAEIDPDLVVIATGGPVHTDLREALHKRNRTHLYVDVLADRAIVGPLVVPGWFSCLHCADLHRLDRDPAWSALAVQLESPRRRPEPSEVAVSAFAASAAALQALAYLDGELPSSIEGTLELCPPDWRLHRRSWSAHPGCPCGAA